MYVCMNGWVLGCKYDTIRGHVYIYMINKDIAVSSSPPVYVTAMLHKNSFFN